MSATTFQHRHHPENGAWRKPHSRARARTTEHAVKASALVGESSHRAPQIGFTGRYLDKETGLWYFRARYYSGILGRFIGRDPLGYVDGMNLYAGYFVPNKSDPSGCVVYSIKATGKSFIARIGSNIGTLYDTVLGLPSIPNIAATLRLAAFAIATDLKFSENPISDSNSDRQYRIYGSKTFEFGCCNDDLIGPWEKKSETLGGKEPEPSGFSTSASFRDENVSRLSNSTAEISWGVYGRPNPFAEIALQLVRPRMSVDIWHKVKFTVRCQNGVGYYDPPIFSGSGFPSHRLWMNGSLTSGIAQGPVSNLWISDPTNTTSVQ